MRFLSTAIVLVLTCGMSFAQDLGSDAQREAGRQIYEHKCAQCHGSDGDGNGVAKDFFWPTPRDFTRGTFKIRATPSGELPTDADIREIIRKGMPYTGMPAWPNLSDDELANVTYYIKTFTEDFADPDFVVPAIQLPKAPGSDEESIRRGRELYEENKCADCHGQHGRGDGKSSATLFNDWNEPIKPADLTKRWTFRGGSTKQDIYRTFTTGLNGTPMPSYADLIAEEDRWHLVNYVYSLSRDEPEYATVVHALATESDISDGDPAHFAEAAPALFPVFGQVIEPGRAFYPSATAVEVRAVFNDSEVGIMLTWNDMTADTDGVNNPSLPAPLAGEEGIETFGPGRFSDAVAIQTPSKNPTGFVKPYFLFGDGRNPVDLWFADLSKSHGELLEGRGSQSLNKVADAIPVNASHEDGQWTAVFRLPRTQDDGFSFEEGAFAPVAFSIWDGFTGERGNKRGITAWYHVYLPPVQTESKAGPIVRYGVFTLLIELALILVIRRKHGAVTERQKG
jgi:mono/diheme cytochrome c family protein